jgi:hypothetical protein
MTFVPGALRGKGRANPLIFRSRITQSRPENYAEHPALNGVLESRDADSRRMCAVWRDGVAAPRP